MPPPKVKSPSELAFNLRLVAYDFGLKGFEDRLPNQRLGFRKLSRSKQLQPLFQNGTPTIPNIKPTAEETDTTQAQFVGVWVGMWPPAAGNYTTRAAAGGTKGGSVDRNKGYTKIPRDPHAVRVIAPIDRTTATYYGLVEPQGGLCEAYTIPIDEVFFFSEFRDDSATSFQSRKDTWARKVREACHLQQRVTSSTDGDEPEFRVEPDPDLGNEFSTLVGTNLPGNGPEVLQQPMDTIMHAGGDNAYDPQHKNEHLCKMITPEVLTLEEAASALQEFLDFMPDPVEEHYTAEDFQQMSEGLKDAGITLEYHLLLAFVDTFVTINRAMRETDPVNTAIFALNIVLRLVKLLRVSNNEHQDGHTMSNNTLVQKSRNMKASIISMIRSLRDERTSSPAVETAAQLSFGFGASPKIDTFKSLGARMQYKAAKSLIRVLKPIPAKMEKYANMVESISKFSDDEDSGEGSEEAE